SSPARWAHSATSSLSTKTASAHGSASIPRPSPPKSSSATATPPTSPRWPSSAARSTKSPSKSATCNAPKSARRRSTSAKSKKAPPPCRTRKTRLLRSKSAAWPASCAATPKRPSRTSLWHERDISHSSVERVIFPDSTILIDYLLAKATDLIDRLIVYPERMKKNLESSSGLIFSGQLLLDLAEAGMLREDAYRLVQSHAMRAWKEDLKFREEVSRDPEITKLLTPEKLARTFDYQRQLGNVDAIFKRVLENK